MEETLRRLLEHFRASDVALNPGVERSAVERFEKEHGVRLPRGISELLLAGNGMQAGMDRNGFRLWSLEEVLPLDQSFCADPAQARPTYFVFMDYMAGSHGYAVDVYPQGDGGGFSWLTAPLRGGLQARCGSSGEPSWKTRSR
jgi:hypothetical protein